MVVAFSSLARILGECSTSHSQLAPFFLSFSSFLVEISLRTLIPLFPQDRSTMSQQAETTVTECSLRNCMWARFLTGSLTMPEQRHSQPTTTSLGKGVCLFKCNLLPALLAEWTGSFTCHCGSTGVEWTPNKSQHTKLTLENKIHPPLLLRFELAKFPLRVRRSTSKLFQQPV